MSTTIHNKGKIKDNAYAALVRSNVFMPKKEAPKKGKGSFKRKGKHTRADYSGKHTTIKCGFQNSWGM